MKTQQEIFDTVATHLLKQNDKSLDSYGECRYRAEDGNMCAVGCLIDTKHYTSGFEGYLADDNRVAMALQNSGVDAMNDERVEDLVRRLQEIHDEEPVDNWLDHLTNVAQLFELNTERLAA